MQLKTKNSVAFISGAGLGTWIWDEVMRDLAMPSIVLQRSKTPHASLADHVQAAKDQLHTIGASHIHLVAHSIGGVIGTEIIKAMDGSIASCTFISAAVVPPGKSYVSIFPFPQKVLTSAVTCLVGTKPPDGASRKSLCSGISEEQTEKVILTFSPETARLYLDRTSDQPLPRALVQYIHTTQDKLMSLTLQR